MSSWAVCDQLLIPGSVPSEAGIQSIDSFKHLRMFWVFLKDEKAVPGPRELKSRVQVDVVFLCWPLRLSASTQPWERTGKAVSCLRLANRT